MIKNDERLGLIDTYGMISDSESLLSPAEIVQRSQTVQTVLATPFPAHINKETKLFDVLERLNKLVHERLSILQTLPTPTNLQNLWNYTKRFSAVAEDYKKLLSLFTQYLRKYNSEKSKHYKPNIPDLNPIEPKPIQKVVLGSTVEKVKGLEQKILIQGHFKEAHTVVISLSSEQETLASMEIQRVWFKDADQYKVETEYKYDRPPTHSELRIVCILDSTSPEEGTFDRPMQRIITQVAIEIFQREPDQSIEILATESKRDVLFAGGFANYDLDARRELGLRLKEARSKNQVFPPPINHTTTCFYLRKGQQSSFSFVPGKPSIPWDNHLAKNSLLSGAGPVLNRFFYRDLSKQVKGSP